MALATGPTDEEEQNITVLHTVLRKEVENFGHSVSLSSELCFGCSKYLIVFVCMCYILHFIMIMLMKEFFFPFDLT